MDNTTELKHKNSNGFALLSLENKNLIEFIGNTQGVLDNYKSAFEKSLKHNINNLTVLYLQKNGNWIGNNACGDIDLLLQTKNNYKFNSAVCSKEIVKDKNTMVFINKLQNKHLQGGFYIILEVNIAKIQNINSLALDWLGKLLMLNVAKFILPKQLINFSPRQKANYQKISKQKKETKKNNSSILQLLKTTDPANKKLIAYFNNAVKLTKREKECLGLQHQGFSTIEISQKLNISNHTTTTHRRNYSCKVLGNQDWKKEDMQVCEQMLAAFGEI